MKKAVSLILVLAMLLGMMPIQAFATEGTGETAIAHEHDYEAVVTDPTCTEQGYTTYTCECGDSYVADYVDALGHIYKNGICTGCGFSKKPYKRLTYFTVDVADENGKTYTDNAVLYLPANYSTDGEPVKLIIYCKQGSSQITSSSNPVESVGFYNYLISLGYAVLGVDGVPDAWCDELGLDNTRVVGNPLAVQGTEKAYDYVVDNYNIDANGCFISGYSQGGHYAQNVIDLTDIPILAAAEQSPVCSMRYHQWDLNASKTVGGVKFTRAARLNVARIYGFPAVESNSELLNLAYDANLVAEYDPWVRNSTNVYTGFVQKSNLWYLPEGTSIDDITMTHATKCPVKIWCAEDDTAISADVMKVFVKAIQNAGGTAEISIAPSGGHGFFQKQTAVGTFTENGKTYNTLPIAVEIADWFAQYGGYERKHTYENGICTVCGEALPEFDAFSEAEAAQSLRQQMKNREQTLSIRIRSDIGRADGEWQDFFNRVLKLSLAHTGVPDEGDYIHRNMAGYASQMAYSMENGSHVYTLTVTPRWLSTPEQEAEVDRAVEALLAELNLWNEDDYGKITGVYNWITENVSYDYDNADDETYLLKHSTYAALIQRNAVCQGYATLLYRLLLHLGVDCRYISGWADNESHGWNIVALEGKYYNVDPTWDRGLMGYYRYFLCTETNFGDHTRDLEFDTEAFHAQYPMAIVPYVRNVTASGTIRPGMEWVLDGDTGTLTVSGTGAIPSYRYSEAPWYPYRESVKKIVVSEGITEVGERAFYWCVNCTSVSLPDSLIAIREYGFNNLRSLRTITLPEHLEIIEFCAFSECAGLQEISLPDSVHTVGSSVFSNCPGLQTAKLSAGMTRVPDSMFFNAIRLWSVELPDSITAIGDTAFMSCNLLTLHLPAQLTSIGVSAFGDNRGLLSITVDEDNPVYQSKDGVLFSKDGTKLLCYPAGKYGSYTVPEGTVTIAYGAFRGTRYLNAVSFPSTLREIGNYAFSYCTRLSQVTFPVGLNRICDSAFRSTGLERVTFENPSVILESGGVFAECDSLRRITLPSNLSEIPGYLFYGCAVLEEIIIPATVKSIGSSAFLDCDSLTRVVIPGNVKTIGRQAFDYCGALETIILEEGVETLADYSIRNCPRLRQVQLPDSLRSIGQECFEECPKVYLKVNCATYGYWYAQAKGIASTVSHPDSWAEEYPPTCTEQGYILHSCGCGQSSWREYVTPALGHDMGEWILLREATCTEEGESYRICSRCDHMEFRATPTEPHSYYATVTPPSCTEEGYTTHTCSVCGFSYIDSWTDALGHAMGTWYTVKEATCTEEGQEQRDCSRCDHSETRVVEALGHKYESVVTDPTCTERGYTTHTCRCGDSYVDSYVDALGHAFGTWYTVKEATCTEEGQEQRDCSRCDHSETRVVEALGHKYESVVTAPTCTERGYTTHTCHCGDSYVDSYTGTLGHDWDNGVVTREPTEDTEGERLYTCQRCQETYTESIPVKDHEHKYESVVTEPTCTERGYTTHTCHCGDSYVDSYVDALGHAFGTWHTVEDPTCTEEGLEQRDCSRCDHSETRAVEALGHKYESVVTEPTCTERGYTTHTCHCGDSYVDSYTDALGHDWDDGVVTKEPTEDTEGERLFTCERCGETYTESIPVKDHEHKYESIVTDPTCTERGYTTHTCHCGDTYVDSYTDALGHDWDDGVVTREPTEETEGERLFSCQRCDATYTEPIPVKDHEHKYESVVTDPTCTERGYTTHTCHCGDSYVDSYVDALGHAFGTWYTVEDPTCTEEGLEQRDCARCDHSETRVVEALGHKYESVVTEPTCTERGYTTHTCHCGDSYVDAYVDALGHDWDDGVVTKEPTEETEGERLFTCERCGETYTESIPVKDHEHKYESVVTEPTCTERGYTTHTCRCGDCYVDSWVEALGHAFGAWYTVEDPTCTEEGLEQRDCSRCDYSETRAVEALGHKYESVVTDPTCTERGYTTHTCHCGDSYVDAYVDALGHDWDDGIVTKEPTVEEEGERLFSCNRCDATYTEPIDKLPGDHTHAYGDWEVYKEPSSKSDGEVRRYCECGEYESDVIPALENPFKDTKSGAYYFEPVLWAAWKGITAGVDATHFGPDERCTRGQVVTFLWRAMGKPEPTATENPFSDVKEKAFYYKAVLWAVENGITAGTAPGKFSPDQTCTRGQVVSFLWRAMGKPEPTNTDHPFRDVKETAYYYKAMLWAVENGITAGYTATTFAPDMACTRGQVVTFLYRTLRMPEPAE